MRLRLVLLTLLPALAILLAAVLVIPAAPPIGEHWPEKSVAAGVQAWPGPGFELTEVVANSHIQHDLSLVADGGRVEVRAIVVPVDAGEVPDPRAEFMAMLQHLSEYATQIDELTPAEADADYNAHWAGVSIIQPRRALVGGEGNLAGVVIALHRVDRAMAYIVLLCHDLEQDRSLLQAGYRTLRFIPDDLAAAG